jgi:hypothetical protein
MRGHARAGDSKQDQDGKQSQHQGLKVKLVDVVAVFEALSVETARMV